MSDSGPPPESKQLMSTGDSVQSNQPTKWNFLEQQTVTLTLNLNDILSNGNQPLLNDCDFSVSGRMAFTCKNYRTSQTDLVPEDVSAEHNNSDPENQDVVKSIDKSKTTLNEASGLLLKCADHLEELKAALNGSNDGREKVKSKVDSKIKGTTSKVIKILKKLGGDTETVNSNGDDDGKPPSDNEDDDGSGEQREDPKEDDNPKRPTNPPDDSSKKDEDSTGNHSTDATEEHKDHERTESELAETTTTEIDVDASSQVLPLNHNPHTQSVSMSGMDKQETGEEQKQGEDDSEPQQVKDELGGSSEEAPNVEAAPQQEDGSPQEPPTLEDLSLSESTANQTVQEEMKETSPEDVEVLASVRDESGHDEPSLPASEIDNKEEDFEETQDAKHEPHQQAKLPQQSSAPVESTIEEKPDDNTAPLLDKEEVHEDEQQGEDGPEVQKMEGELGRNSEDTPNAGLIPQQDDVISQDSSTLENPPLSESPSASRVDKKEQHFDETRDAGSNPQHGTERPQESSTPTESAIEQTPDDNTASLLDKKEVVENEEHEDDKSGKQSMESEKSEEAPSTGSNPQNEAELSQDPLIPAVPVIEESAVQQSSSGQQGSQPVTSNSKKSKKKKKKDVQKDKNLMQEDNIDVQNESQIPMDVLIFLFFGEMNNIREKQIRINDIYLPKLLKGISLFYKNEYCKLHTMDPQDVLKKLLGDKWEEKKCNESEICKLLVSLFSHETCKTSAQTMIAYLHNEYNKVKNPKEKASFTKKLLAVFTEEIVPYIEKNCLKNMKEYAEYRMKEIEDNVIFFTWKDRVPKFHENEHVLERIEYYKMNSDTFEDRLLYECYTFLILTQERFEQYHRILDVDLNYISTRAEAYIKKREGRFFGVFYGFDAKILGRSFEEERIPDVEPVDPNARRRMRALTGDRETDIEHVLTSLFTCVDSANAANRSLESTTIPKYLIEIFSFHKSEFWKIYKTVTPEEVMRIMFGPKENWADKNEPEHAFCRVLERMYTVGIHRDYIHELFALWSYELVNNAKTSVIQHVPFLFVNEVYTQARLWILKLRQSHLNQYVSYRADCWKNYPEEDKYNWKQPIHYKAYPLFKERMQYYLDNNEVYNFFVIATCYEVFDNLTEHRRILDDDFDFIFTGRKELIEETEETYILSVFRLQRIDYEHAR